MLFRRRDKQRLTDKVITWVWPRRGWSRAARYVWFRVARLPGTPHSIAAGIASGAAVSFTPFIGFHFLMGFLVAWILRGNLFASAIGTFVGNPWTFPLMFALNATIGAAILGEDMVAEMPEFVWANISQDPLGYLASIWPAFMPLLVGSIPSVVVAWIVFYFAFKILLTGYHANRVRRKKPDYLVGEDENDT
ncbi:hypothetical protein GCM10017044_26180 [Kordiimonas sediminis]|uniref:DUF2062 domain-containing protein n=1 Tax=Kordiimonas sediminis TaxID=1735581 RepID=A0A919EA96_9PROT|nr:DUF2062 domain-containing protein [Kordiimonas sediminis]GHF29672.1 hypothetical protein GCM10017044_26180 [Kordiimonas sediminis]